MSEAAQQNTKDEQAELIASAVSNPTDDINRIIIGLGGQGSRVVNEVRKAVLRHGDLPAGLEFVAIDSDRIALSNLDSVPEDQRVYLAAPDDNITETVVPWLPHEFRPKAGGGCGMQRLTGKAMYLVHRHRVLEAVRAVARKLRQRTQVSNFMVVVVNAFGGGTGSGMAIDFTLDLRADLKEITGQDPLMFGVGILPSRSETIQRANGVAALKEIHYLLSNKEPIVVGGRDYSNPFELYFLVGREVMGIERDDDLLQAIVRFTIDLGLIPSSSRDTAAAGKGAGWVDLQDIRTLVKGASHMFSTFGYYRAGFPDETLTAYFEALDKLHELRKELPSCATDVESRRQALEDKRIALAHMEDVWRNAKARANRLRSDGVLGANRPELAKLLADLARMDEEMRKMRRETAVAEQELPDHTGKRERLESQVKDWEKRATALKKSLLAPAQSRTSYTVPLSEPEIEHLAKNRHLVTEGNFRSVMEALGRLPDYHDKTMEVVGKNKILYLPLINYRMSFHSASMLPPRVLTSLRKHGFVRFDAAGNPIVNDDHLWMIMAMLSSRPENVDANKVSARAFKEVVEGHVARRAAVKIVPSESKRFEVVIHSWMVGLQVSPVAPGYPPRLRDLEWLMPEYEQVAREGGLAQHHAFLYGDPLAFAQMASVPVDRVSSSRTNELVTDFWASYAPIEPQARWFQLPPVIAETSVAAEDLTKAVSTLETAVDEFRASDASLGAVERLNAALTQGLESIEGFGRAYAEDQSPLRDRIGSLVSQLETTRSAPRDLEKLLSMEELAVESMRAANSASALLTELRGELLDGVRATIVAARGAQHANAGERGAASSIVRWEHVVAQAEGKAARIHETSAEALRHLDELTRTLQRAQEMLRARALAPHAAALPHAASAATTSAAGAAGSADDADAPSAPAPRHALEMEAGIHGHHNGNGNSGNGHGHLPSDALTGALPGRPAHHPHDDQQEDYE